MKSTHEMDVVMQEEAETASGNSRRDKRRRAILDAAAKLFLENGYERTTLSDVLALSGGSRSTLADLFGGKEGLFTEVLRETSAHVEATFDALGTNDVPIEIALRDLARQFIEAIFQPRTIAIVRILMAEGTRIPEIAEAFFRMGPDMGDKKLAAFLQRGVEAGALRPLDPVAMSRAFRSMVIGDTGMRVAAGAPIAGQLADALAQVDPAVEIFLSGARASP